MPDPSDGMTYPNRPEEMQDMEMEPVVIGPGAYSSPDPDSESGRLVPLSEHPLAEVISKDFGQDVAGAPKEAVAPDSMTVAELDEKYGDEEGYPESGNKAEKVEFAEQVESEREEAAETEADEETEIDSMTVAELDEQYGDYEDYPESGNKAEKVAFAKSVEEE